MEGFFCFVFYKSVWSTKSGEDQNDRAQWNVYGRRIEDVTIAHMKVMMEECSSRSSRTFLDCFTHLANANQKEALFPKSCTEVKAERRFLPKAQQSLDCASGEEEMILLI